MWLNESVKFQPHQAPALGNLDHVVLALESNKQERIVESSYVARKSHGGQTYVRDVSAWGTQRGHSMKWWKWSLAFTGDPKMLEVPIVGNMQLAAHQVWNHPREGSVLQQQNLKELEIWITFWHQIWISRAWGSPSWLLVLLWFSISLHPLSPL